MKNLIFILLASLTFTSCIKYSSENTAETITNYKTVMMMDGCEYVVYSFAYQAAITHKGDCKNPIHCYNQ